MLEVEYMNEIYIFSTHWCRSQFIGRSLTPGYQYIAIGHEHSRRDVLRAIFHTLGRASEHTRLDRDLYVQIKWCNIIPGKTCFAYLFKHKTNVYMILYTTATLKLPLSEHIQFCFFTWYCCLNYIVQFKMAVNPVCLKPWSSIKAWENNNWQMISKVTNTMTHFLIISFLPYTISTYKN